MDFGLNEEQRLLQESCRRLLDEQCRFDKRKALVDGGGFDARRWQTYAEMGWLGLAVPESRGGVGAGAVEQCILMEAIGRALCVEPVWAVGIVAAQLLVALGASPLGDELLRQLIAGDGRPVLAHGEAHARGEVAHVGTRASQTAPGRWVINGEKSLVVAGNIADRLIVSARTSGATCDADGISLFLIDPAHAGVERRDIRLIDNRWCAHVRLTDVEVTEADLLGPVGAAYPAIDQALAHGALALCAEAVGLMERALWSTRDYLKLRKQFGSTLSSFQVLQHRMSEMLIELELSRSMVFRCISRMESDSTTRNGALSATKVHIGRSGRFVCGQAIQLHGGIGVTDDYVIGHYFKRMTLIDNALGSTASHLERLANREREVGA
ncbi:acyl-CoA dehydrogenase domain protein [Burkholderia sp. H160]|nr:acyl-CoA dehydrogenase domain protein [Burkholderia sp. H160]